MHGISCGYGTKRAGDARNTREVVMVTKTVNGQGRHKVLPCCPRRIPGIKAVQGY